ncbi:MAG TPA: fused MFS/spermidine synthase [Candidatus Limnocylindria bacterium]|nr:fused MFS/spermidine synthase [Candidatus Limnocylindria bacterium]
MALAAFGVSGALGLVDEIIWIRKASLVFGATTLAVSTVVAAFFLGLALGSAAFGRWSARIHRPLRAYAWLEAGVGVLALASPFAFTLAERVYGSFYPTLLERPALLTLVRFVVVALIVLPPAFLMGGTLPLFCQRFARRSESIGWTVGMLYGWNTFGAAVGCVLCGFVLIPAVGLDHTLRLGGILNLILAAVVFLVSAGPSETIPAPASIPDPLPSSRDREPLSRGAIVVGTLFFATGFVALGNEVLWTRFLSLLFHNTVHTYTLTLGLILTGIVLGSVLAATVADRIRRRAALFGGAQILGALVVLGLALMPARAWRALAPTSGGPESLGVLALLLLIPATLSGALLPIAVRMVADRPGQVGGAAGALAALNTLGGIAGSLLIGFAVLPALGIQWAFVLITGLGLLAGIAAIGLEPGARRMRAALAIVSVVAWLVIPFASRTRLPADLLAPAETLVDYREGRASHVAVVRKDDALALEIDRWWQGENRKTHQILAAHVPMLMHERPRRVLVVGIGTGLTASRFLMYDLERLDCVDVEGALLDLVPRHFDSAWLRDSRTRCWIEDGRNYLAHADARYDLISVEVGQIVRPGLASFYTVDFYRQARERLAPGGLLSQFVPIAPLRAAEFHTIVRSFLDVFPSSVLWYNTSELLLVGRREGPIRIVPAGLARITNQPSIRSDLAYSHWGGPRYALHVLENLLGGFLLGPADLARVAGGGELARDEKPELEYALAGREALDETAIVREIENTLTPIGEILPIPPAPAERDSIAAVARANLRAMEAEVLLRNARALQDVGQGARALASLEQAVARAPGHVAARRRLGEALREAGRPDEAWHWLAGALTLDSTDAHTHLAAAYLLHGLGRIDQAVPHYRTALRFEPERSEAHNNLGSALAQRGDLESARAQFAEAVRLDPRYAEAHHNLANALAALRRDDEAVDAYRRALQLRPKDSSVHFHAGLLHERRGEIDVAAAHYRAAIAREPWIPAAREALERVQSRSRR